MQDADTGIDLRYHYLTNQNVIDIEKNLPNEVIISSVRDYYKDKNKKVLTIDLKKKYSEKVFNFFVDLSKNYTCDIFVSVFSQNESEVVSLSTNIVELAHELQSEISFTYTIG